MSDQSISASLLVTVALVALAVFGGWALFKAVFAVKKRRHASRIMHLCLVVSSMIFALSAEAIADDGLTLGRGLALVLALAVGMATISELGEGRSTNGVIDIAWLAKQCRWAGRSALVVGVEVWLGHYNDYGARAINAFGDDRLVGRGTTAEEAAENLLEVMEQELA